MTQPHPASPRPGPLPLVSVVVPSFNQAHYLPMALDSVMFQDYPEIELIICSHGSTDATRATVEAWLDAVRSEQVSFLDRLDEGGGEGGTDALPRCYEPRYPQNRRILTFVEDENIGGSESYNAGFRAASGTYCTYLVGDDLLPPNAVRELVDALETDGADVAYSDMFVVDDAGRILQHLKKPDYSFADCLARWYHLGVGRLYRRELHERCGYYDPAFKNANDYDMFLRFAMAGARFVHVPRVLYLTRKHGQQGGGEPAAWRPGGYDNLMRESIACAKRARAWLRTREG